MRRTGQVFLHAGIWLGIGLILYVLFLRQEAPPPRLLGPDSIELKRTPDGHFYIDGRIGDQSARFLVDTGASIVSVPQRLALRAGLKCQQIAFFGTANGPAQGCSTRVSELRFGPFLMRDVAVVILPNLNGEALLGMNVLRRLRLDQAGDRLRLSARD